MSDTCSNDFGLVGQIGIWKLTDFMDAVNDEELDVMDYASEEEFVEEFGEMGFGMCDERECGMAEIKEVINDSQPDRDSAHGLALLANGNSIAQGGD